jgi:hypothetical protein
MTPAELRLRLLRNGYAPLPLIGKAPNMKNWQAKADTNAGEIELWSSIWPDAKNTGALTRLMPTLDLDILNEEAARAAEEIVRTNHEEHGLVLVRIGRPPKRAIPFMTDKPFKKILVILIAPNGAEEKIEFLGDGQQVAVAGLHPDIGQPYRWHGGELWQTGRAELPYIREAEAQALVDEIVETLCRDFGYRRAAGRPKQRDSNGHDPAGGADWLFLFDNIRDSHALHDTLCKLAAKLIRSGMSAAAAVNLLRALMQASSAPRDARWEERFNDIARLVASAEQFREPAAEPKPPNGTFNLKAFEQIVMNTTPNYLIKGIVPRSGLVVVWGPPKCGKSFWTFDLVMHVALDRTYRGIAYSKGPSFISRSKAAWASPTASRHGAGTISLTIAARWRSGCSTCPSISLPIAPG